MTDNLSIWSKRPERYRSGRRAPRALSGGPSTATVGFAVVDSGHGDLPVAVAAAAERGAPVLIDLVRRHTPGELHLVSAALEGRQGRVETAFGHGAALRTIASIAHSGDLGRVVHVSLTRTLADAADREGFLLAAALCDSFSLEPNMVSVDVTGGGVGWSVLMAAPHMTAVVDVADTSSAGGSAALALCAYGTDGIAESTSLSTDGDMVAGMLDQAQSADTPWWSSGAEQADRFARLAAMIERAEQAGAPEWSEALEDVHERR